jgi:hypothetical protein
MVLVLYSVILCRVCIYNILFISKSTPSIAPKRSCTFIPWMKNFDQSNICCSVFSLLLKTPRNARHVDLFAFLRQHMFKFRRATAPEPRFVYVFKIVWVGVMLVRLGDVSKDHSNSVTCLPLFFA